ncbi:MAG: hypothetical protein GEV28_39385 [Actinophytocola sp.]|uniref:hypothetical protein n=1 Tax=Actinophytocola sp. TaxID=1872138 RepID=UPI0013246E44|nr:hypothetical protein [Actinophytocola sp.]MPZ86113.1 hypothetical protein [Actinophytocola sp.]
MSTIIEADRLSLRYHDVTALDEARFTLTGGNVLEFAGYLRESWDSGYATELAELFSLPLTKSVGSLSHGRQCALGITIGRASRTQVTMFDESYLGLDAPSRYKFYDALLAEAMAHPRTMIISTHLIEEVSALFEEVLILDEGRLVLHEQAETLRAAGSAVTGDVETVDRFVTGMRVLGVKTLGRTKSAMVHGELDGERQAQARARAAGSPRASCTTRPPRRRDGWCSGSASTSSRRTCGCTSRTGAPGATSSGRPWRTR